MTGAYMIKKTSTFPPPAAVAARMTEEIRINLFSYSSPLLEGDRTNNQTESR
jgi:hypothetical protein